MASRLLALFCWMLCANVYAETATEKRALADRLTKLTGTEEVYRHYFEECSNETIAEDMAAVGYREHPEAFGGLSPDSGYWKEVETIYSRYHAAMCGELSARSVAQMFSNQYAAQMSSTELRAAVNFYSSPAGQLLSKLILQANGMVQKKLEFLQGAARTAAEDQYQKDIAALIKKFHSDPSARALRCRCDHCDDAVAIRETPMTQFAACGKLPHPPNCPAINSTVGVDPVMLTLQVHVPENAHSFSINANFFTSDFPESTCTQYNDFFVLLLDSTYSGDSPNPADKNIATYTRADNTVFTVTVNLAWGNTGLFTQCENGSIGCSGSFPSTTSACTGTSGLVGTGMDDPSINACSGGGKVGGWNWLASDARQCHSG